MPVDTADNSTEPRSERKVCMDNRLQIKDGRCPAGASTDGQPPATFIASY